MSELIRMLTGVGVALVATAAFFVGANKSLDLAKRQWAGFTAIIGSLVGAFLVRMFGHAGWVPGSLWMIFVGAALGAAAGYGLGTVLAPGALGRHDIAEAIRPYTFVGPAMLFLFGTLVVPGIRTLWISLQDPSGAFIGAENYGWIFTNDDIFSLNGLGNIFTSRLFLFGLVVLGLGIAFAARSGRQIGVPTDFSGGTPIVLTGVGIMLALFGVFATLRGVVWNNLWWVVAVTGLSTAFGLAIAVLADKARMENLAKSLIFLPMAISFVGAAVIWRFVYTARPAGKDQIGLLNALWVGLGGDPQLFLQQQPWNSLFLIIVMIWIQTGFAMVVLSAAIKGVPTELLEAARVDGASEVQVFWRVTLPQITTTLAVVVTTLTITVLKIFDLVKATTGGTAGTDVLANRMYDGLRNGNFTGSATFAVMILILVLPVMWINIRRTRREVRL